MALDGLNSAIGAELTQKTGSNGSNGASGQQGFADNFETFLTLLTTQLQHQDPMEPLKTKEFTQQLVSFSQVEQSIKQNENLENILSAVTADNFSSLVGFLGKDVTMGTNQTRLQDGQAEWTYDLGAAADEVELVITDSTGGVVRKMEGPGEQGSHTVTWDGTDNLGNSLPEGSYSLNVTAMTAGGKEVKTDIRVSGRVEGVETDAGKHKLRVNGQAVPLDSLVQVSEPALENSGA